MIEKSMHLTGTDAQFMNMFTYNRLKQMVISKKSENDEEMSQSAYLIRNEERDRMVFLRTLLSKVRRKHKTLEKESVR